MILSSVEAKTDIWFSRYFPSIFHSFQLTHIRLDSKSPIMCVCRNMCNNLQGQGQKNPWCERSKYKIRGKMRVLMKLWVLRIWYHVTSVFRCYKGLSLRPSFHPSVWWSFGRSVIPFYVRRFPRALEHRVADIGSCLSNSFTIFKRYTVDFRSRNAVQLARSGVRGRRLR